MPEHPTPTAGPLVLGASGHIGQMFQTLWAKGLWPDDALPLWHARGGTADVVWDIGSAPCPPLDARPNGLIVLAGKTSGTAADLAVNAQIAAAALDLARDRQLGPVILCSSVAVYGNQDGPWSEQTPPAPASPYGQAKACMEHVAANHPHPNAVLRIANVAGADALTQNARHGPVSLTHGADGTIPKRMYIGPQTLAQVMLRALDHMTNTTTGLGPLNVAAPGSTRMDDLLAAAGAAWRLTPGEIGLADVPLCLNKMQGLFDLPPQTGTPATLIAQARAAGWDIAT